MILALILVSALAVVLLVALVMQNTRRREAVRDFNYQSGWIATHWEGSDYHVDPDDVQGSNR